MGIRWQYLAEGDKFRWYRLVSKENMAEIEADLERLATFQAELKKGPPLLAPWKLITNRIEISKARNALREHLKKFADFHRDMMANTEYPRLAGEVEKGNYTGYPGLQEAMAIRARVEAAIGTKKKPKPKAATQTATQGKPAETPAKPAAQPAKPSAQAAKPAPQPQTSPATKAAFKDAPKKPKKQQ